MWFIVTLRILDKYTCIVHITTDAAADISQGSTIESLCYIGQYPPLFSGGDNLSLSYSYSTITAPPRSTIIAKQ